MSVLSVPRIHVKGKASWNPATCNNNDQWSIYDFPKAELYWPGLEEFGITRDNVRETFAEWALEPRWFQEPGSKDPAAGWWQPPAEWDYFGGLEWSLHSASEQTVVTGGLLEHGGALITDDPLVGACFDVVGDTFPGGSFNTPARFVDNNPDCFWSSTFYLKRFQLGTRPAPGHYLTGEIEPGTYGCSRLFNMKYNLNRGRKLQIAGSGGTVVQGCIPADRLDLHPRDSMLLKRLEQALKDPGVKGLMIRCVCYLTRYFTLPEFDCVNQITDENQRTSAQYRLLAKLWREQLDNDKTPTANPAVSTVVGTIGLWQDQDADAVSNMPGGRFLIGKAQLPGKQGKATGLWTGPAVIETHPERSGERYVSLDLATTVAGVDYTGTKNDLGTLELNLVGGLDPQLIGMIPYAAYDKAAFEARSAIVDLKLPPTVTEDALRTGYLELSCQPPGAARTVVMHERLITIETEQRSYYVEQGTKGRITVQVRERGAVPQRDLNIRVKQYVPAPPQPLASGWYWQEPADDKKLIRFVDDKIKVPSGIGKAEVEFDLIAPGCPIVVFFSAEEFPGDLPPKIGMIPAESEKVAPWGPSSESTSWASYSCVRVMPFDNKLPDEFWSDWKTSGCRPEYAWEWVYRNILYLHDALYPVMRYVGGLDLGDKAVVDKNIDQIVELCGPELRDSTLYMPVSRELSNGKRTVLRYYQAIVHAVNNGEDLEKMERPV